MAAIKSFQVNFSQPSNHRYAKARALAPLSDPDQRMVAEQVS
ncbi:hypothetical protein [Polaromonas sp. CG9_12]|nr:hypothetical protein [Polaromonas sp. CG9_12]